MAAQKGINLRIEKDDGAGGFVKIAGLTTRSVRMDNNRVDVSTDEDVNVSGQSFATYIGGLTTFEVTGSGITKDPANAKALIEDFQSATENNYKITWEAVGDWQGLMFPSSFGGEGTHDGAITFDLTLSNTGPITFTPAA